MGCGCGCGCCGIKSCSSCSYKSGQCLAGTNFSQSGNMMYMQDPNMQKKSYTCMGTFQKNVY